MRWNGHQNGDRGPGGLVWLFGEMFILPFRAFVYGMERLLDTMRDAQKVGDRGMHVIAGAPLAEQPPARDEPPIPPTKWNPDAESGGNEPEIQEKRKMDRDLNDDTLKLVRFKILFVKRDYEHAFKEQEELVSDNIDGTAFTAWKIAEFIQTLSRKDKDGKYQVELPRKWAEKNYPKDYSEDGYLTGFPEDDKKYLRVYYEVLERYKREKFRYEEEKLDVLREIRDEIGKKNQVAGD